MSPKTNNPNTIYDQALPDKSFTAFNPKYGVPAEAIEPATFDPAAANNAITTPNSLIPEQTDLANTLRTPLVNADSETRRGVVASPNMANPDAVHEEVPEKKSRAAN